MNPIRLILPVFLAGITFAPLFAREQAIVPFDSPDPVVIEEKDGSGFYAFVTGRGIGILHSQDLLHWEKIGKVFERSVPPWAKERIPDSYNIWAADIVFHKGWYRLYYSVSTFGGQRSLIGLAVNKTLNPRSPDYRWEDQGIVLESAPGKTDYNAIDSALFIDRDGKHYLYWGSYWTGIKAVEVNPKTGKPFEYEANRSDDLKIPTNYKHIAARSKGGTTAIEAPFVVRHGKYYYLFVSWDDCCAFERSTYKIVIGRSEKPLGPFLDQEGKPLETGGGTILMESTKRWRGTGHNGFLSTKKHGDWIILAAYDANDPQKGRLTQVRPLYWTKDGWMKIGAILEVPYKEFDWKAPPTDPRAE
ncbi:MAG: arabinan endo-1,5-alpha-L-arabinosidase [Planctomycetaceae bacterium]|nr:arabinan endo-1,5-alpha-L-arabinosidase [Planctomycetaceae bacterium]